MGYLHMYADEDSRAISRIMGSALPAAGSMPEFVVSAVDNLDDGGQDWSLNSLANNKLLDLILHIKARSLLVEAVLLLQDELSVDTER